MERPANNPTSRPPGRASRGAILSLSLFISAVSPALGVGPGVGAGGDTNRFVALQLRVTATEVSLMQALQFPGKAKPEPKRPGLDYVIRAVDGAVIGRGSIENPRFERSCTEERAGSGILTHVSSTLEEGITVLRLPVDPAADSIEFSKSPAPGAAQSSAPRSLGKVSLKSP